MKNPLTITSLKQRQKMYRQRFKSRYGIRLQDAHLIGDHPSLGGDGFNDWLECQSRIDELEYIINLLREKKNNL